MIVHASCVAEAGASCQGAVVRMNGCAVESYARLGIGLGGISIRCGTELGLCRRCRDIPIDGAGELQNSWLWIYAIKHRIIGTEDRREGTH